MPRRKISSNASKLKKGRGAGHGKSYIPFLFTREVPSLGKASRIKGWKTGREHHFLSTLESNYFYSLEWSPIVVDIREQFPLPLSDTQAIAERLSISHPYNNKTDEPWVATTDFLIDFEEEGIAKLKARSIKSASDLSDARTIEKLEIERTYWHERGVDWGIVTENEIPKVLAGNVEWIHTALDPSEAPGISFDDIPFLEKELNAEITANPMMTLARVGMEIDRRVGLRGGTSLWVVRHLIASRQWEVNMMEKIVMNHPLRFTRLLQPSMAQGNLR